MLKTFTMVRMQPGIERDEFYDRWCAHTRDFDLRDHPERQAGFGRETFEAQPHREPELTHALADDPEDLVGRQLGVVGFGHGRAVRTG